MKSSTKDQAEGTLHKVKGKIKEIAGKASMNDDLEAAGKEEKHNFFKDKEKRNEKV